MREAQSFESSRRRSGTARMRRALLAVASLAAAFVVAAGVAGGLAWRALNAPLAIPDDGVMIDVAAGTPFWRLTEELSRRGLTPHPRLLGWYGRLTGDATHVHAGEYKLQPGLTPVQLLARLVAGDVYLHHVTIVEGWRYAEMIDALRRNPAIDATALDADSVMAELGEPDTHPEGQFLPDTYSFAKDTPAITILERAHAALETTLADAWARRAPGLAIETPYQALILASIIEKETALPSERPAISGVFNRRLMRGMRLQTDPTVIYGLGDEFDGDLRTRDLSRDTPYNTYTRRGLPPTPIALAGKESIEAAVAPDQSDALYFVATGDPDGSHRFSATLEEHNRAVREYLRRTREHDN
jgi:peptidoglycan lytic transglycosylase G